MVGAMRRLLLLGCLLGALGACSGNGKGESTGPGADDTAVKNPEPPEGKDWGGWRWKGQRDDCFFKVGNDCFDSLAAACKKAGCKGDACVHDKSAPANVSCKE
jgi:hypothetical protein